MITLRVSGVESMIESNNLKRTLHSLKRVLCMPKSMDWRFPMQKGQFTMKLLFTHSNGRRQDEMDTQMHSYELDKTWF